MEYVKIGPKQLRQMLAIAHIRYTFFIASVACQTLIYSNINLTFKQFVLHSNFMLIVRSSHSHKLKATTELILCGWPKSNFDAPSILKHFPRLKVLRIEHSNLTHINNDFPELVYLEVCTLR